MKLDEFLIEKLTLNAALSPEEISILNISLAAQITDPYIKALSENIGIEFLLNLAKSYTDTMEKNGVYLVTYHIEDRQYKKALVSVTHGVSKLIHPQNIALLHVMANKLNAKYIGDL